MKTKLNWTVKDDIAVATHGKRTYMIDYSPKALRYLCYLNGTCVSTARTFLDAQKCADNIEKALAGKASEDQHYGA